MSEKRYEVTFEWPNGDWTWQFVLTNDYHAAMLHALMLCPVNCRVHSVKLMPERTENTTRTTTN